MQFGISTDKVISILSEAISHGKVADSNETKRVIAQVVEENNQQLLEDVKKLIRESNTAKFA